MNDFSSLETLDVSEKGGFVSVVLNRPQARNAMSLKMVRELLSLCEWLRGEESLRGVIFRGTEGHFCAGGDIKDMAQARAMAMADDSNGDPYYELNRLFGQMILAVNKLPQVVISVMEGVVLGGGFGLACVSDIGICDLSAKFGMPETTLGIVPAQIAPFVVERIGLTQTRRLTLMAERFNGQKALEMGVVHYLEPSKEALEDRIDEVCERIRLCAPQANAKTKEILLQVGFVPMDELLDKAAESFSKAVQSPEGLEGTMAFIEKRKPSWVSEA